MVARVRLGEGPEKGVEKRLQRVERAAPLGYSSITRGGMRIASAEGLTIQGTSRTTGTQNIDGTLNGSGSFDWTGPSWMRGAFGIQGSTTISGTLGVSSTATFSGNTNIGGTCTIGATLTVNGNTTLNGDVTLNNDLTLGASGQITAGTVRINPFGGYGGQVVSTGTVLYLGAGQTVIVGAEYLSTNKIAATDIEAFSLDVLGPKNFRIPHPMKDEHWLRHGSTESPVSGTEYTGRVTVGHDGSAIVELPEYFEALNKPNGRTVQVTPVGRPFAVGADEVADGSFTAYGEPGREVFWLVKAERFGGDFLLEEQIPPAPFEDS